MTPDTLAYFNLVVNGGQLVALIVAVFKAGRWIGAMESRMTAVEDRT